MPSPVIIGVIVVVVLIVVLVWYFLSKPEKPVAVSDIPPPPPADDAADTDTDTDTAAKAKADADAKAKADADAKAKADADAKAKAVATPPTTTTPVGSSPTSTPISSQPATVPLDPIKLKGPYTLENVSRSGTTSKTGGILTVNNLSDDGGIFLSKKPGTSKDVQWVFARPENYKGSSKNIYSIRSVSKTEDQSIYSFLAGNGDQWDSDASYLWKDAGGPPAWWEVTPVDDDSAVNTFTIRNHMRGGSGPSPPPPGVTYTYSYLGISPAQLDTVKWLSLLQPKEKDTTNVQWKIKLV